MKLATETMKYLFTTYFRILKRMPTTALLPPVLEGLAKFAHFINVDFFEDLVATMSELVEQKVGLAVGSLYSVLVEMPSPIQHLKVSEILHCTKTVCVVLSGEGQALNIDPLRFYTTIYNVLPCLPFQSTDGWSSSPSSPSPSLTMTRDVTKSVFQLSLLKSASS
jgi:nucleolar complex protein 3